MMKAIVLAAGKGERLRRVVKDVPKPMIKINGKPILEHNIELLRSYDIADIYINLHYLPDVIRNYFNNGKKWDVNITYSYEPKILGTAGGVRKIANDCWKLEVGGKNPKGENSLKPLPSNLQPFLVIYGDNYYNYNLAEIIKFHNEKKGLGTIGVYEKEDVSQSGIVEMNNNNKIIRFIEKPKPYEIVSHLVNTGIYICEPDVISYIPEGFSDFGKDILPFIIKREKVYGYVLKGRLIAIDTPELLRAVQTRRFK
jgi:NDP-sugar pyrophosphorylase family protein